MHSIHKRSWTTFHTENKLYNNSMSAQVQTLPLRQASSMIEVCGRRIRGIGWFATVDGAHMAKWRNIQVGGPGQPGSRDVVQVHGPGQHSSREVGRVRGPGQPSAREVRQSRTRTLPPAAIKMAASAETVCLQFGRLPKTSCGWNTYSFTSTPSPK